MMTKTMAVAAPNDAELVSKSLTGNRDAFGQIVARYQSLLCSLAYSATGSLSQSEDLAQETFVAAWKQLHNLREPEKLCAWLCRISRNLTYDALRQQGREPSHCAESLEEISESHSPEPLPVEQAISNEEQAILWRSLERIPEIYREPLVLFYRERQSIESVAKDLDLSEDAVKQRLSRGRKLLQEQVLAFVEGALEKTAPGKAFTLGVVAALPLLAASTGVTTAGVTASQGSVGTKGASALTKILLMIKSTKVAVAVAVAMAAAVVTPIVVRQISSADDPRYWEADSAALDKIPPVFILRPTQFARHGGSTRNGDKIMSKDIRVNELLEYAYRFSPPRMVLPSKLPQEHFDLLLTLPDRPMETLQQAIQDKFGLTAHRETREADVLILKVRNANAPGLQIHTGGDSSLSGQANELTVRNMTIAEWSRNLDWRFAKAVVDQTGLNDRYDIHLQWPPRPGESDRDAFQRAMLEQLGLELAPGREPIEMLVVEKTKLVPAPR
jgi:uncharacterized protein (TIGR03435 family)